MGDPITSAKTVDLDAPVVRPSATKARGRSLSIASGGHVVRRYDLVTDASDVVFIWEVQITNGECLGNGGGLPGRAIDVKDGYNQALETLTAPKGDVFDAIDALIKGWGLMP